MGRNLSFAHTRSYRSSQTINESDLQIWDPGSDLDRSRNQLSSRAPGGDMEPARCAQNSNNTVPSAMRWTIGKIHADHQRDDYIVCERESKRLGCLVGNSHIFIQYSNARRNQAQSVLFNVRTKTKGSIGSHKPQYQNSLRPLDPKNRPIESRPIESRPIESRPRDKLAQSLGSRKTRLQGA